MADRDAAHPDAADRDTGTTGQDAGADAAADPGSPATLHQAWYRALPLFHTAEVVNMGDGTVAVAGVVMADEVYSGVTITAPAIVITRLDPREGEPMWLHSIRMPSISTWVRGLTFDPDGNLIVGAQNGGNSRLLSFGGGASGSVPANSGLVVSYAPDGSYRWHVFYPTQVRLNAIASDEERWCAAGTYRWTSMVGVAPNLGGGPLPLGFDQGFFVCHDFGGGYLFQGLQTGEGPVQMAAIALGGGRLVIAGAVRGTIDFGMGPVDFPSMNPAAFVASFDASTGSALWVEQLDTGRPNEFTIEALALDESARPYVAGSFRGDLMVGTEPLTGGGGLLVALDADGNYRHHIRFGTEGTGAPNNVTGLSMGSDGHLYIAGTFDTEVDFAGETLVGTRPAAFEAAITLDGEPVWTHAQGVSFRGPGSIGRLHVSASGRVTVIRCYSFGLDLGDGTVPAGVYLRLFER